MKEIFLITVFFSFLIQTKAQQVIDSVSVNSTKKEISYKKNELGVQIQPDRYSSFVGINYTRFFGKKIAFQVEYTPLMSYKKSSANLNKTTVGVLWYSHQQRKRWIIGANVSTFYYFNTPEGINYKSNMSFYVHPEIGYNFLIKDRISIQPNISIGVGRDFHNRFSFYTEKGLGLRLKYRF